MKFFIIVMLVYASMMMLFPESEPEERAPGCSACSLSHSETVDIDATLKIGYEND